jgi:hypothetical protein
MAPHAPKSGYFTGVGAEPVDAGTIYMVDTLDADQQ